MKITGAEWKLFEAEGWPEDYVWSDESTLDDGSDLYAPNGELTVSDNDTFVVPSWWSTYNQSTTTDDCFNIRSLIRKWRNARDYTVVTVTVKKTDADTLLRILAENGWNGKQ